VELKIVIGRESLNRVRYLIAVLALTVGCGVDRPPVPKPLPSRKPAAAPHSRLRVRNVGTIAIRQLIVRLPNDELRFGDIESGATSVYLDVLHGVYSYAAFRHSWEGRTITEPVIDWISEKPYSVGSFTYQLRLEPYGEGAVVFLLDVLREVPSAFQLRHDDGDERRVD
jgi:hypothetical protein